ncbi:hypothetical protein CLIB1423_32S00914 [[Candida] railenensis]|uniref:Uncharacterized protein n=1 Tax=[Candida] railenensis TaxID=45579 RepID=A0A9P0W175_9ASCO|nr:hypothetical protein CLIB1423_32S00914 [[Candida] railenensis]
MSFLVDRFEKISNGAIYGAHIVFNCLVGSGTIILDVSNFIERASPCQGYVDEPRQCCSRSIMSQNDHMPHRRTILAIHDRALLSLFSLVVYNAKNKININITNQIVYFSDGLL